LLSIEILEEEKALTRRWLIIGAMTCVIALIFAAQVCMFSFALKEGFGGIVYGAIGPVAGAAVSAHGPEGSGYAVSDSSGHYSISEGLKTGTYNVTAFAVGYLMQEVADVAVTVGQTTSNINFDLQLSGGVSGRVTDAASGDPLNNIMVVAYSADGGGSFGWSAMTGSDGKYLLATNLATDSYNVSVMFPEGHISQSITQAVTAGAEVKNVDFALPKSGTISGKITTPSGAPLKDIVVSAFSESGYYGYATTDVAGQYRIGSGLGTASYTVMVFSGMNYNHTDASVTAGQETSDVDLQLTITAPPPSGAIKGKATDAENGKPIADASISAEGPGGSGSTETDSNGDYVISSGLGTGTYTVTVTAPGYQSQSKSGVSVTVNLVTSGINFELNRLPAEQSGTITGSVTGAPNPIPEFQYPVVMALSLTLIAVAASRLFMRTRRLQTQKNQ
jgi:protocatechuate 3,4-dioxygenase beta subunit